ncbi:MAG TPA: GNAT family N-acetyltransferase [Steroidobacter sp.]
MTTSAEISIRRAAAADAATIARLGAATFTETFGHLYKPEDLQAFLSSSRSPERYQRMLGNPRMGLWLAVAGGTEPIGYAVAGPCKLPVEHLEADAGEVQELYVLAQYHGRRLGTTLLETALEWLKAQRFSALYVGVWSDNLGAQRLYGRYGFEKVGEYGFLVGDHIDREFILRRFR